MSAAPATTSPAAPPPAERKREYKLKVQMGQLWVISTNHVSVHGYQTDHPWEAIFEENYFLTAAHWFINNKGDWTPDEIVIYRKISLDLPGGGKKHYWERCRVIVTYAHKSERVSVIPIEAVMVVGSDAKPSWPPAEVALAAGRK